jgi:hypothetical protein
MYWACWLLCSADRIGTVSGSAPSDGDGWLEILSASLLVEVWMDATAARCAQEEGRKLRLWKVMAEVKLTEATLPRSLVPVSGLTTVANAPSLRDEKRRARREVRGLRTLLMCANAPDALQASTVKKKAQVRHLRSMA